MEAYLKAQPPQTLDFSEASPRVASFPCIMRVDRDRQCARTLPARSCQLLPFLSYIVLPIIFYRLNETGERVRYPVVRPIIIPCVRFELGSSSVGIYTLHPFSRGHP